VDKPIVKKTIVIYSGRFQPFHKGHYAAYEKLVSKFGASNVYIGTSDKSDGGKSPFNFKEKVVIMGKMFGIPPSKIVQVSNPYSPKEILSKFDGKTTAYVAAVGEKDATRLAGKYFKPYKGKTGYGYDEIGYTYIIPADSNPISGTDVRSWLSSDNAEKLFLKAYPKFDKEIYKMITNKLIKEEVTTDTSYVYDPIAEQIAKLISETDSFIDEYFLEEEPNPLMDKEINYTAADGKKKKITVRGALRLPKDHEAHIQAKKLVGPDDAPANQPKKKEEPNQPGQPVKKGDTEQGKADDKPKGDGGEGGKEQGPPPEQKLKGAELKSDAEDRVSKERKAEELKTALDNEIKSLNKEEQDFIDKGEHKQGSKFMNSLKDGIKKVADTKVVKAIGHVLQHKGEMIKGAWDGHKALASGQKIGSTKNKETGEWEYSDEKRKEQVSHIKHFYKDLGLLVASVAIGGGLAAGAKALAAGSGLGGAASATASGAVGAFTHGAGGFAAHLGKDAIKHVALESMGMGGTQAALGGAGLAGATMGLLEIRSLITEEEEMNSEKYIQNIINKMAEKMETFEMSDEQLLQSIKSYKKGKDFGDLVNEVSNVNTANTADVPDGAFIKKNKKRTLDKDKSEAWYKNGGYTQTDFPKADTIFGDDDAEERTIKYTIKNLPDIAYVETEFIKEDINVDVDKGDTVLMGKFKNKKVVVKDFGKDDHGMPTINGKVATTFRLGDKGQNVFKQDENINEIQKGFFKGKMKIGGQAVDVEVELVGVDNKNREFVTKVIGIDKQYQSKLPIGSTLPIPARLFRHGGWAKIKTPSAFNEVHYEDWHYLAIKKLWDKAGTFTRKKIAAVVTKNPNSAWAKIARELRYSDYDEVTDFTDALNLAENVQKKSKAQIVGEFIKFAKERLELENFPDKIKLITDENFPKQVKSFGGYDPQSDEIFVYAGNNRNIVDVVRTLAHELVHLKQRQDGRIGGPEEGATGSDIENEANAAAGILLRDFGRRNEHIYEMAQSNLNAIEKYADSQLSPEDIEFTKHFFDRVNDPRNGKEISDAELTGFFKRLAKHKKEFTDFLNKYKEIVVTDSRSDINIPFVKSANKVIAKTVMRKADFKSSTPKMVNEELKWQASTLEMCMNDMVPLTLPIVKQLVEIRRTNAFHITDIDNLSKLVSLEGKSKSISAFNKVDSAAGPASGKGMWTKGGILVLLSGIVLAESISDLWSKPDKSGIRWITPGNAIHNEFSKKNKIIDFAPQLKPLKEKWEQSKSDLTNQEKQYFIKTYIDTAYKLMIANKQYFQNKYLNSDYLYYNSDWNEVILSKIKVEKIAVIQDSTEITGVSPLKDYPKDVQEKYKELKQAHNQKVADFYLERQDNPNDKSKERIDAIKKKYKNVEIITSRDVPSFIKKNGGYIRESVNEALLLEGGAYGHMNHPFDISMNLTFGDLKKIINNALDGKLGVVREKTDGQALAISWKNGRLIAARNKGHLANGGANALDMSALASKFGGRGALSDAYNFAMKDLSAAISGLGEKERQSIFKDGSAFCNLEVIYPQNANVIPYGQSLLVFHNVVEYDEKGVAIGGVKGAESKLASMIKQTNAHIQSKYTLQGPPITQLPKDEKLSSQKGKFNGMLSKLQSEFGLGDKDGIAEYHFAWWMKFVNNSKKNLSQLEKEGLARRWAFDNKSFGIKSVADEDARKWADGVDKDAKDKIMKGNIRKFEDIFLGVGAEVLSFMSSVLTAQPDKALQSIKASLESSISDIRNGGSEAQIKRLEKELQRLNAIGGFDKLVPNEGLVFFYKGNTYKLTGTFAPLNQILGIFKFGR
jgi:hypothetical protein